MNRSDVISKISVRTGSILLLLAILLAAAAPGLASPSAPLHLTVVGPRAMIPVGQPFSVLISAEEAVNLGAFEFQFTFDPAVASAGANDLSLGAFLSSTGRTTGELRRVSAPGHVRYGAYSYGPQGGPAGAGSLVVVNMAAAAPGVSSLALENLLVTDIFGTPVVATATAGSVQVGLPLFLPLLLRSS